MEFEVIDVKQDTETGGLRLLMAIENKEGIAVLVKVNGIWHFYSFSWTDRVVAVIVGSSEVSYFLEKEEVMEAILNHPKVRLHSLF